MRQASARCSHTLRRLASGASSRSTATATLASVLESAFDVLAAYDVVVGPTHDGGYYLVGAKGTHPGLFNGDGMETTNALETLLAAPRPFGFSTLRRYFLRHRRGGRLDSARRGTAARSGEGTTNGGLVGGVGASGDRVAAEHRRPVSLTPSRRLDILGVVRWS